MPDLAKFLAAWDDPGRVENVVTANLCTTPFGNINSTGEVGDYQGHALTRWHPQFDDAIEPKIRALVHLLIERFDWVTYSSCQGHLYEGHPEVPVERSVGLVPRTRAESQEISGIMRTVIHRVTRRFWEAPILLELLVHTLESEDTVRPALDFCFRRHPSATWEQYFEYLDERVNPAVLEALASVKYPQKQNPSRIG